jgi:uncharacterized protein (DUF2235 family)
VPEPQATLQPPRQLIVLCDGTNNNITGRQNDTNVVKLAELLTRHAHADQLVHYDPGVGNAGEMPGATVVDQWRRRMERIAGLAFGRGVYENIAEAYVFLMRNWRHERDRIFLFGFSRGAFTARAVAGLVNRYGLLQPHLEVMVPTLLHHYFAGDVSRDNEKMQQFDAISAQVIRLFSGGPAHDGEGRPNPNTRRVHVYFTGTWDTVASVGMWPFGLRITVAPTVHKKRFVHVRQALALDEQRAQFQQRLYLQANSDRIALAGELSGTLKQLWFRGAHCDVGGYYRRGETALCDRSLAWLVSEALGVGLWLGPLSRLEAGGEGEAAVLQALHEARLAEADAPPLVHSELHATPLWALAGLAQRDTQHVQLDNGVSDPITPVVHPSVAAFDENPRSLTEWSRPRPKAALIWALLGTLLLPLFIGWVLGGCRGEDEWAQGLACVIGNNLDFQRWQFEGGAVLLDGLWRQLSGSGYVPSGGLWAPWTATLARFASPRWALVWDLAFIAAYATLLAYAVSWAFARISGLRRVDVPPSKLANLLGWALPAAVFADLAENTCTWFVIAAIGEPLFILELIGVALAIPAALASVVKWVALLGVLALLLWGLISPAPSPHRARR